MSEIRKQMSNKPRIAIVGGGVNGVGTAYAILRSFSDVTVTIYSHHFTPYTTGDGAGGIWGPFVAPGTPVENMMKWSKCTWDLFNSWWKEKREGVFLTPVQVVSREELETPFWNHIPFNYKELNQQELKAIGPDYTNGHSYLAFVAEPSIFLPNLMKAVTSLGGKFENRNVRRLDDLSDRADIIINCSGIGSHDLVPDPTVFPVRGQVMRVKAPWINFCLCDESDETFSYIIPNTNSVVLGGTHQEHDWRTTLDECDSKKILENCAALVPQLKRCEIISEWVGLRPARRDGIRLEEDEIRVGSKHIPIVHNYGHGGSGVTTFWGCSLNVKNIVGKILHTYYAPPPSKM